MISLVPDHTASLPTIYALSSGFGRAAVAVIRISGPRARFVIETLTGRDVRPRYASYRALSDPRNGHLLDHGVVLFFPGPASQTGEDVAEVQVHGSRAVIRALLAALSAIEGCRPAEPGEFVQRALRNGKIDLIGLEALADLIDSETELQRQQAVGSGMMLRGSVERWRELALDIRADLEAGIDFSDEDDVARHFVSRVGGLIDRLVMEIDQALATARHGARIRDGLRVALVGAPNAGKSSLLNALAGRDVAIVSDIAGTTRDRIDVFLDLGGYPAIVTDTAGIRDSVDTIEREGIRRSRIAAEESDLVLWLHSAEDGAAPEIGDMAGNVRFVLSKADLVADAVPPGDWWAVASTVANGGIDTLLEQIGTFAREFDAGRESALVTSERQRLLLSQARAALERARSQIGVPELCAEEVRGALLELERLVGRIGIEDVLGAIFSRFCIGK